MCPGSSEQDMDAWTIPFSDEIETGSTSATANVSAGPIPPAFDPGKSAVVLMSNGPNTVIFTRWSNNNNNNSNKGIQKPSAVPEGASIQI